MTKQLLMSYNQDIDLGAPQVEKQGYNQVLTFSGLISFTRGALNGTRSLSTKNFTVCERRLITKVE